MPPTKYEFNTIKKCFDINNKKVNKGLGSGFGEQDKASKLFCNYVQT